MALAWRLAFPLLLACSLAAQVSPSASRSPDGRLAPAEALKAADVIIVGEIVDGSATDTGARVLCKAVVRAERVIKGGGGPGTPYPIAWDYQTYRGGNSEITSQLPKEYGLWLLQSTGAGSFKPLAVFPFADGLGGVFLRFVKVPAAGAPAYPQDAPFDVKLAAELGSALEEMAAVDGDELDSQYRVPSSAVVNCSATLVQSRFMGFPRMLEGIDPVASLPTYRYLAVSARAAPLAVGVAGLLRSGDTEALFRLEKDADPIGRTVAYMDIAGGLLRVRLDSNLDAARALARASVGEAELPAIEKFAASKLASLRRPEFLPYLAVMMESPNADNRGAAAYSLCVSLRMSATQPSALSGLWKPEMERYCPSGSGSTLEESYVAYWKRWWAEQKTQYESDPSFPRPATPVRYHAAQRVNESARLEVPMEIRFRTLVNMLTATVGAGNSSSGAATGAPSGLNPLAGRLDATDQAKLAQIARAIADRLQAHQEKVTRTLEALRAQGKRLSLEEGRRLSDEQSQILTSGLDDARIQLSGAGWEQLQKYLLDMAMRATGIGPASAPAKESQK
jgi:hypothetical protein